MTQVTPIHLVMAIDDDYTLGLGAVAASLLNHLPSDRQVFLYILDGGLSSDTRKRISTVFANRIHIRFCDIPDLQINSWSMTPHPSHLNESTLLRLHIAEALPPDVDKVLYLDADTLVTGDVSEVFTCDLKDNTIAAVPDEYRPSLNQHHAVRDLLAGEHRNDSYFNAGVILIDLERWRHLSVGSRARRLLDTNSSILRFPDQDALNIILNNDWSPLPARWNRLVSPLRSVPTGVDADLLLRTKGVIHFVGPIKPWNSKFPHGPIRQSFLENASDGNL